MSFGIEIKKIFAAIADFGMTFIYNFLVFWGMTQILGVESLAIYFCSCLYYVSYTDCNFEPSKFYSS